MKLYQKIASVNEARKNCERNGNTEWLDRWAKTLENIEAELPSGSGFDSGTEFDMERSNARKLVFHTSYHHMDDGGCYDGWTDHAITIVPTFDGFDMKISGRNRNDIKKYIGDVFHETLDREWTE